MDPFSITAGIAGLLSLSIQIHQMVTTHIEATKNAPKEAQELVAKLTALIAVLEQLERFIERQSGIGHFAESSVLYGTTRRCIESLDSLQGTLSLFTAATGGESKSWRKFTRWPLTREKHKQTISLLQDYMAIFNLSFDIDAWTLLSKTDNLVMNLQTAQARQLSDILDTARGTATNLQECRKQLHIVQKTLSGFERSEILRWVGGSVDPSQNFNEAIKNRHTGTGEWLLQSEEFCQWIDSAGLIWLHGIPGSGKTVLSSTIIEAVDDLCTTFPDRRIAYYYFDFQNQDKQRTELFVRCLLRQLIADEPSIPAHIDTIYGKAKGKGLSPSLKELCTALYAAARECTKDTYIVLDALDEFPPYTKVAKRKEIFGILRGLLSQNPSNIHILVTSRDHKDIRDGFHDVSSLIGTLACGDSEITYQEICLESNNSKVDINSYIEFCLDDPSNPLSQLPQEIRHDIQCCLRVKAGGMFLLVASQLEVLRDCLTAEKITLSLQNLPGTIEQQYERTLASIEKEHVPLVSAIFKWLTSAKRSMRLEELAEAAATSPAESDGMNRLLNASSVLTICRGLIIAAESEPCVSELGEPGVKSTVVRFAHYTVKEYLLSGRSARFGFTINAAENHVLGSCVRYLLHVKTDPDPTPDEFPLLRYAAKNWCAGLAGLDPVNPEVRAMMLSLFLDDFESHSFKWLRVYDPLTARFRLPCRPTHFPGALYYAAYYNLHDLIRGLIRAGHLVNEEHRMTVEIPREIINHAWQLPLLPTSTIKSEHKSSSEYLTIMSQCQTALHLAVEQENIELLRLLIGYGADCHEYTSSMALPVGNVEHDTDPAISKFNSYRKYMSSQGLGVAVEKCNFAMVKLLLDHGAQADEAITRTNSALAYAIGRGAIDISALLLERGADVNKMSGATTALLAAIGAANSSLVRLCIDYGADVNMAGLRATPLVFAIESGNTDLIQMLIDAGADVNFSAVNGVSTPPLMIAIQKREPRNVEVLLHAGADVNLVVTRRSAPTSVEFSIEASNSQLALNLSHAEADANHVAASKVAMTPLAQAVDVYHRSQGRSGKAEDVTKEMIFLLLRHGAKPYAARSSLLNLAAMECEIDVFRILSDLDATEDSMLQTLLEMRATGINIDASFHKAASKRLWTFVRNLVQAGVGVPPTSSARDLAEYLLKAICDGQGDLVKLLLEAGADANKICPRPLSVALDNGYTEIAELLKTHGAHQGKQNFDPRIAYHEIKQLMLETRKRKRN